MWTRPALCRLCECPASDGGVQIDQLDSAKFSKWWLCKIGSDFQPEAPEKKEIICNFCICDARLEHEYSVNDSASDWHVGVNWWSGHEVNLFFVSYYIKEELLRPCSVNMGIDAFDALTNNNDECEKSNKRIKHLSRRVKFIGNTGQRNTGFNEHKGSKELRRCLICDQAFKYRDSLLRHLRKQHPAGSFVLCNHNRKCSQIFRNEAEKSEHLLTITKFMKMEKCNFCHRMHSINSKARHLRKYHENLICCSYYKCGTYFHTEMEKKNHEAHIHQTEKKLKCLFCNLFFPNDTMLQHLKFKHISQLPDLIKCKLRCKRYFLTEAELEEHVAEVHYKKCLVRTEAKCIYCKKICIDNNLLYLHVKAHHSDIRIRCKFRNCSSQYFHTQIQADLHFKQQHQKIEEKKQLRCLKCDYRSACKENYKGHILRMHGKRNWQCPKCTKFFSSPNTFKYHLKFSHAALKVCQHCDSKLRNLRNHLTQEKCKRCQKVLMCLNSAQLHKKVCKLQTDPGGKVLSF